MSASPWNPAGLPGAAAAPSRYSESIAAARQIINVEAPVAAIVLIRDSELRRTALEELLGLAYQRGAIAALERVRASA
jgi:hypothetical protein